MKLKKRSVLKLAVLGLVVLAVILPVAASATEMLQFGSGNPQWPTNWVALPELNDPVDTSGPALRMKEDFKGYYVNPDNDFVGDAADPAAYYAVTNDYVYFRMRVKVGAVDASALPSPTFSGDSFWIFVNPYNNYNPRYAFAWDNKGRPYYNHAMEMNVMGKDESVTKWTQMEMDDRDGNEEVKIAPPDFRWDGGDGFIRTVDHVATANFGETTFIDWAISKQYLATYVPKLIENHNWKFNYVSRTNGIDHDKPNADAAAGQTVTDPFKYSRVIDINVPTQ